MVVKSIIIKCEVGPVWLLLLRAICNNNPSISDILLLLGKDIVSFDELDFVGVFNVADMLR